MASSPSPPPDDPVADAAPADVSPAAAAKAPGPIFARMTPGTPLTADQAARITSDLIDLIELIQGDGAGRALIAQYAYLWMLGHFLRQLREVKGAAWDEAPEVHDKELDEFREFMSSGGSSRIRWMRMRMAGEKARCAPRMRRMILALPLAVWSLDPDNEGRASGLRFWFAWGRRALGGNLTAAELAGAAHSWEEIDAVKLGPLAAAELDRLAEEEIRAGALFRGESVRTAHALLLVRRALTRLLAQAAALDAGRQRAEVADIEAAAQVAGERFGADSPFERALAATPRIAALLESYARQTRFPYALVNWTPADLRQG